MPRATVDLGTNTIQFHDADNGGIAAQIARVGETVSQAAMHVMSMRMQQQQRAEQMGMHREQMALAHQDRQDRLDIQRSNVERETARDAATAEYQRQQLQRQAARDAAEDEYRKGTLANNEERTRLIGERDAAKAEATSAKAGKVFFKPEHFTTPDTVDPVSKVPIKSNRLDPARAEELDQLIYQAQADGDEETLRAIRSAFPQANAFGMSATLGTEVAPEGSPAAPSTPAPATQGETPAPPPLGRGRATEAAPPPRMLMNTGGVNKTALSMTGMQRYRDATKPAPPVFGAPPAQHSVWAEPVRAFDPDSQESVQGLLATHDRLAQTNPALASKVRMMLNTSEGRAKAWELLNQPMFASLFAPPAP